ncbi:MAG: GTP-binding protein [Promethearchaeota archaeon]
MKDKQIQLYLINGFLGSGKTTFILKLLSYFSMRKCGVLMNEYGKIGIDGLLLPQKDLELIEINGGSIFCQCRHDLFFEALVQFSTTQIDILFIEASGLADPATMDGDIRTINMKVGGKYNYAGNICLVDSQHFLELLEVVQTIERQIRYTSVVIINKIDLVTSHRVLKIKNKLLTINHRLHIIQTSFGNLTQQDKVKLYSEKIITPKSPPSLCETTKSAKDVTLIANHELDALKIQKFFTELARVTRRMKGFIKLKKTQWYYLDSVNGSLSLSKTNSSYQKTMIVVIFKEGVNNEIVTMAQDQWKSLTKS